MEAALFAKMLSDKHMVDLKKMKYKFPEADIQEYVEVLKTGGFYKPLSILDFSGEQLVYMDSVAQVHMKAAKTLLGSDSTRGMFGIRAMEDEIASTLTIENIDFSRNSVRRIMRGYAPADDSEKRIYGIKKGLEFICDPQNTITEQNIYILYNLAIADSLAEEDKLLPGHFYRHDKVYLVGQKVEHTGLPSEKVPAYMAKLVEFIKKASFTNDLIKAAVIHFYIGYLHPYFDGNGRMARLIHLWYLVQNGYAAALFVPLSEYIQKSRSKYNDAYTLVEKNAEISGVVDVTPFLVYFIENVYHKLGQTLPDEKTTDDFRRALESGLITEKERDLWFYVLSAYGSSEFSTKELERDFGNAAYDTIRRFVLKFEDLGLLSSQQFSNRVKYKVKN